MKRMALGLLIIAVAVLTTTGCALRPNTSNTRYRNQGQQYQQQYDQRYYQQQQNPYYRHDYDPYRQYDPHRQQEDYWRRRYEPGYDPYDPYYRRLYDPAINGDYRMLRLHNDYRMGKYDRYGRRLEQLQQDYRLDKIAQDQAEYMARINRLTHYGYNNERPWDRVTREVSTTSVAENIAIGVNEQAVFAKWLGSSGHKQNIEGDYSRIGIGRAVAYNGDVYWCVVFVK